MKQPADIFSSQIRSEVWGDLVALLVFKTSVGLNQVPGGFDSHPPPPGFVREKRPPSNSQRPACETAECEMPMSIGCSKLSLEDFPACL